MAAEADRAVFKRRDAQRPVDAADALALDGVGRLDERRQLDEMTGIAGRLRLRPPGLTLLLVEKAAADEQRGIENGEKTGRNTGGLHGSP